MQGLTWRPLQGTRAPAGRRGAQVPPAAGDRPGLLPQDGGGQPRHQGVRRCTPQSLRLPRRHLNLCSPQLENALLDRNKRLLKITDFGYAKTAQDSLPKSEVGTPNYAAPEVIAGNNATYDGAFPVTFACLCLASSDVPAQGAGKRNPPAARPHAQAMCCRPEGRRVELWGHAVHHVVPCEQPPPAVRE